ncbi:NAD(P)H-binding protein [Paenibacillus hunanensis]|uniref:NAD(P)H-binding protein n=1 Tax=Paenibacillus hunanensis TaxID=539262 RepID=UPI002A6B571B|nr:NAD(P)H-binding protein [Paenibacillus hunanensis]WPP41194.1 NAD(P)H-binding protein [Paenibacillus hunanensis]
MNSEPISYHTDADKDTTTLPGPIPSTILLTAGNGKTSLRIAEQLHARNYHVRNGVRRPNQSTETEREEIYFDWYDTDSYAAALEGMQAVYLVAPTMDLQPERVMNPFIEQALALGIRRFVLLSSASIAENGPLMGKVHHFLNQHAPEWAALQPSYFMQNFTEVAHAETIRTVGKIITATGDGKIGFVDADDIAAVAARLLTDTIPANRGYMITGPESLSYAEAAAIISNVIGKMVVHQSISEQELRDHMIAAGMDATYASALAGLDTAIRLQGIEDQVSNTVQEVTGKPPRSLRQFMMDEMNKVIQPANAAPPSN